MFATLPLGAVGGNAALRSRRKRQTARFAAGLGVGVGVVLETAEDPTNAPGPQRAKPLRPARLGPAGCLPDSGTCSPGRSAGWLCPGATFPGQTRNVPHAGGAGEAWPPRPSSRGRGGKEGSAGRAARRRKGGAAPGGASRGPRASSRRPEPPVAPHLVPPKPPGCLLVQPGVRDRATASLSRRHPHAATTRLKRCGCSSGGPAGRGPGAALQNQPGPQETDALPLSTPLAVHPRASGGGGPGRRVKGRWVAGSCLS